jgi:hypothetical protein
MIGQWLAHDSPTPDQFSTAYGSSACILEQRVSADEKAGCAGYQALPVRSIAPFVLHVYYNVPPSMSTLWTLDRGHWFRKGEQNDTIRRVSSKSPRHAVQACGCSLLGSLTCRQTTEYGTMQACSKVAARPRNCVSAVASSALRSLATA